MLLDALNNKDSDVLRVFLSLLAVAAAATLLIAAAIIYPIISAHFRRPQGFPIDTRTVWSHKDGATYFYCRNLSSGRVVVEQLDQPSPPRFYLSYNARCPSQFSDLPSEPDLAPSLTSPAYVIYGSGQLSIHLPRSRLEMNSLEMDGSVCDVKLTAEYLKRARRLVSDLLALNDDVVVSGPFLKALNSEHFWLSAAIKKEYSSSASDRQICYLSALPPGE